MSGIVTEEMLDVAVKKAVEAGLLPRHASRQDASDYQELIRYVVQAALAAAPSEGSMCNLEVQSRRSTTIRERIAEVRDMGHWRHGYAPN